jgi:NAD/NADP transhydrogenase beta subunit
MQSGQPNVVVILVAVVVVGLGLFLRLRRMAAKRPLRPGMLWVVPAIFVGVAVLNFVQYPPHGLDWLWIAVALVLGAALGWQRGRLMKIWVEPDSGTLMSQGSGWAIVFLLALIALRAVLRAGLAMEAGGAITPALINDTFVIFAVGLFATQRAEMALRAQRLRQQQPAGGGAA